MENFFPQYGKHWVFSVARVRIFPRYGNFLREFSTPWKTFFHSMENIGCLAWRGCGFFHAMETFCASFPRYGKLFSTVWKTLGVWRGAGADFSTLWKLFVRVFHAMENFFPQYGKRWVFGVARMRNFPRYGNFLCEFSTPWKTFFHTVENRL